MKMAILLLSDRNGDCKMLLLVESTWAPRHRHNHLDVEDEAPYPSRGDLDKCYLSNNTCYICSIVHTFAIAILVPHSVISKSSTTV